VIVPSGEVWGLWRADQSTSAELEGLAALVPEAMGADQFCGRLRVPGQARGSGVADLLVS
jgi:hypothetical protein